jgi:FkbM family methyltransferase
MKRAFLAFAEELARDPGLLERWIGDVSAIDTAELVVHPGDWTAQRLVEELPTLFEAYSSAGSVAGSSLTVLTAPITEQIQTELVQRCVAIYGETDPPGTLGALPHADSGAARALALRPAHALRAARVPGGHTLLHRGTGADWGVLRQIFQQNEYALERLAPWGKLPRPDEAGETGVRSLIVDCGANIGASTVYFASRYPTATVIAIEPEVDNFNLLVRNTAAFERVIPLPRAIATEAGELPVVDPGLGEWAFRVGGEDGQAIGSVEALTIEDVLDLAPDATPFLLKIDIEGGEDELFTAHPDSLDRFPVVAVELHDWMFPGQDTSRSFLEWHRSYDRDIFTLGENVFSISPRAR